MEKSCANWELVIEPIQVKKGQIIYRVKGKIDFELSSYVYEDVVAYLRETRTKREDYEAIYLQTATLRWTLVDDTPEQIKRRIQMSDKKCENCANYKPKKKVKVSQILYNFFVKERYTISGDRYKSVEDFKKEYGKDINDTVFCEDIAIEVEEDMLIKGRYNDKFEEHP